MYQLTVSRHQGGSYKFFHSRARSLYFAGALVHYSHAADHGENGPTHG